MNLDIDLNRIEMNCSYLAVELKKHGYIARIRTKTDWKKSDFLTLTQINRVRKNVNILIKGFYKLYGSPDISTTEMLTWREINSLEQNIKNLDTLLQWMIIGYRYSGTFYSGQEVILP